MQCQTEPQAHLSEGCLPAAFTLYTPRLVFINFTGRPTIVSRGCGGQSTTERDNEGITLRIFVPFAFNREVNVSISNLLTRHFTNVNTPETGLCLSSRLIIISYVGCCSLPVACSLGSSTQLRAAAVTGFRKHTILNAVV